MNIKDAFEYEARSAWWWPLCRWEWLSNIAATYIAWKVGRKWRRYCASLRAVDTLEELIHERK